MSNIKHFADYFAAFERAYESDDWTEIEGFFTEDAVYEVGLPMLRETPCRGRREIIEWFRTVLDQFDRRFASRELELLEGPTERSDQVWVRGTATYSSEGIPSFVLELEETLRFEDGRIAYLEDRYTSQMLAEFTDYLVAHASKLGISM